MDVSKKIGKLTPHDSCSHANAITRCVLTGPGVLQCLIKNCNCAVPCSQYNILNPNPPYLVGPFRIANDVVPQYPPFRSIELNADQPILFSCVSVKWEVLKACVMLG